MAHGISQKLDGALDAEEYHAQAGTAVEPHHDSMPRVWRDGETAEASPGLLEAGSSRNPLHPMPCEGGPAGRASAREADESVQGVRHDVSSQSQQEEQHMQLGMSFDRWPHERDEALGIWDREPDVPRVAHGVKQRVDRLAELGNAVIPQIPQMIGHAILEAERTAA
jgi:DNA (cytosine-5)-methyltransferase 1